MPTTNGTQNWKIFLRADVRYVKCAMLVYPAILWLIDTDCFTTDGYWTKMSPCNHHLIFVESQIHIINAANPGGTLNDGVEDRLNIGGRAANDTEHLGRCSLMFQGFTQFCIALLQFLEQPHVLDGDHRLVGKGLQKSDLLGSERTRLDSSNKDRAERCTLAEQWDSQPSPGQKTTLTFQRCGLGKFRIQVCNFFINMNLLPVGYGSPGDRAPIQGPNRRPPPRKSSIGGTQLEQISVNEPNRRIFSAANSRGIFSDSV